MKLFTRPQTHDLIHNIEDRIDQMTILVNQIAEELKVLRESDQVKGELLKKMYEFHVNYGKRENNRNKGRSTTSRDKKTRN